MKGCPSCSSMSKIEQMLGWLRAEVARASRRKRSRAWSSAANFSGRNLRATDRPRRVSSAL